VGGEPAFQRAVAVAACLVVTEQAGFMQHRQGNCVQLEGVLVGVAVAQVAAIDRQLRGALQGLAPTPFVVRPPVAVSRRSA
jgi:hypothetical protein